MEKSGSAGAPAEIFRRNLPEVIETDIDLFGLKGAHVVITGASGGIGIATVKLFDRLGAHISAHRNTQQDVQAGTTNSN